MAQDRVIRITAHRVYLNDLVYINHSDDQTLVLSPEDAAKLGAILVTFGNQLPKGVSGTAEIPIEDPIKHHSRWRKPDGSTV